MGSDNNYYNIEQHSDSRMTSTPYYQTLSSQSQSPMRNNEWMSPEQNSDVNSSSQSQESESSSQNGRGMCEREINSRSQRTYQTPQQQFHMSASQWSFPSALSNPYQRFCSDSHYGIIISPNISQQDSTPNSSLHSLNSDLQMQQSQDVHLMKTNQHLKKVYYQGLH